MKWLMLYSGHLSQPVVSMFSRLMEMERRRRGLKVPYEVNFRHMDNGTKDLGLVEETTSSSG